MLITSLINVKWKIINYSLCGWHLLWLVEHPFWLIMPDQLTRWVIKYFDYHDSLGICVPLLSHSSLPSFLFLNLIVLFGVLRVQDARYILIFTECVRNSLLQNWALQVVIIVIVLVRLYILLSLDRFIFFFLKKEKKCSAGLTLLEIEGSLYMWDIHIYMFDFMVSRLTVQPSFTFFLIWSSISCLKAAKSFPLVEHGQELSLNQATF